MSSKFNISEELPNMQIYANELIMYSWAVIGPSHVVYPLKYHLLNITTSLIMHKSANELKLIYANDLQLICILN